jgi:CHAT domain-containing protein
MPVWRILHVRERPDVITQLGPGLVAVACPACGAEETIEAPMLLIRPDSELPLLLAVSSDELAEPSPPSGRELAREAQAALRSITEDIAGPMIPLPRRLLPLVLIRDLAADAADPDGADRELYDCGATLAGGYRTFLQLVRDSEPERRATLALHQLWRTSPGDLPGYLQEHPELGSAAAHRIVTRELDAGGTGGSGDALQARLHLVEGLADGRPVTQVAAKYLGALERFGQRVNLRLEQLLASAEANPGPAGIPQAREALGMAVIVERDDLESPLSADLAARLLSVLVPDGQRIEEVIGLLMRALSLIPDNDPRWPAWAGNLAAAYHSRITGDSTENWETARDLLDRACAVTDRAAAPRVWAINQTNYGLLLSERPGGASAEDLGHAIEHLHAGLEERSPVADPVDWAYSQQDLGLVYRRRATGNDLLDAAECYRQALAHLLPEDHLQLWATLQNNLADVLLVSDPADADGAEIAVQAALHVIDPPSDPLTGARALWNLGRIEETRHGKLSARAVAPRREALQLLTPELAPALYLNLGGELADSYGQLGDWHAAADTYIGMLTAFGTLYDAQASAQGRRSVMAQQPNLARWATYALARAGRPEQAVEAIENGRARQLSVTVARETADLDRLTSVDPQLVDRYQMALAQYRATLTNLDRTGAQTDTGQRQITTAEHGVRLVLQQIRDVPGFERFLQPMSVADIRQAGQGCPVIYLVSAPAGSYALTVSPGGPGVPAVDAVAIPEVTSVDVVRLVFLDYDTHAPGLLLAQEVSTLRRINLLPAALARLAEIQPLAGAIADVLARDPRNRAIVIPTGLLGLVPLHAIPMSAGTGQVLDDIGEIHIAPSAAVFAACAKRASAPRHQHLVGVADPESSLRPLPGSQAELAAIRSLFEPRFPASCAVGPQATRSWLLQYVGQASHLHLGCHGGSTLGGSSGGRLQLANGTELTIDDLIDGRLDGCRVVVASACQSGHYSMADVLDEFTGLPAGFLQAGAACAIVSLWQVEDRATALLMARLYELLDPSGNTGKPLGPVAALRRARTWLRQLTADQVDSFIQAYPPLSDLFGRPGTEPDCIPCGNNEVPPYAAPQYWAAFAAWGG